MAFISFLLSFPLDFRLDNRQFSHHLRVYVSTSPTYLTTTNIDIRYSTWNQNLLDQVSFGDVILNSCREYKATHHQLRVHRGVWANTDSANRIRSTDLEGRNIKIGLIGGRNLDADEKSLLVLVSRTPITAGGMRY